MTRPRWIALGVVVLALIFALAGGEYSTWSWLTLRRQEREEQETVARLKLEVDSLSDFAKAVETDPRVQERIARESYGMLRQGEYLYRLVPEDDSGRGKR